MPKYHLECAYLKAKFKYHDQVKNVLLDLIDQAKYSHVQSSKAEVDITKTDWQFSQDFSRDWVKYIQEPLAEQMLEMYKELGYDGFTLYELWFQQYGKNSQHGWHTHSGNFTNVYYLEMFDDAPKTEIVVPYSQKEILTLDIEEGDIVVFPSFTIHKAPMNINTTRKTIISYNTNVQYSDNIYGQGLEQ